MSTERPHRGYNEPLFMATRLLLTDIGTYTLSPSSETWTSRREQQNQPVPGNSTTRPEKGDDPFDSMNVPRSPGCTIGAPGWS